MNGKSSRWVVVVLAALMVVAWSAAALLAAEPGAAPGAPGGSPVPAVDASKMPVPPATAEKGKDEQALREQTIYIPYEKLRKTFEKEGRGVFLPYEKFQELWQAAQDRKVPPAVKPPVGALITEIDNEATVSKDVVRVKAVVKISLLTEGWHEIPLRLADAAITEATIGGQPARIVTAGPAGYKLLLEKKGKEPEQIELVLNYAKGITKAPGLNSVSFEAPQVAVGRWEIRVPEPGIKVSVQPQIAATEEPGKGDRHLGDSEPGKEPGKGDRHLGDSEPVPFSSGKAPAPAAAQETRLNAYVGATPTVRIEWTPKSEGATGLEALATVQTDQRVTILEGVMRTRCQLDFAVSRAELRQVVLEVPADQKITNVFDPNVRQWSVAQDGAVQKVTAQLFEPATQRQAVVVEMERFFDQKQQGPVAIPVVKVLGIDKALAVARQQGTVVVQVGEGLRGEVTRSGGLLQVDAAELSPAPAGRAPDASAAFSYRFAAVPFDLQLSLEKVQPRILVDSLIEADLQPDRLTLDVLAVYTIERAGVFELVWQVPAGFEVRQVAGRAAAGAAEVQVSAYPLDKDKNRLVISLSRKAIGKVGLHLRLQKDLHEPGLLTPGKAVSLPVGLPLVVRDGIEQANGRLLISSPESLQVNPTTSDGLRPISFADALQGMQSTREPSGKTSPSRPVLAFAFAQEPPQLALSAERRKPQVTVEQTLVARVEEGVVRYEATLVYDILYSGVKSLRVDLPEGIAADVQNVTPDIRKEEFDPVKESPSAKPPAQGYKAWRLSGETELLGTKVVKLKWDTKTRKLDVGRGLPIDVPRLQPIDVDRAGGKILLAKVETVDIQDQPGKQEGLRAIDPQEVKQAGNVAGGARAFEFYGDSWEFSFTAKRYELQVVKQTSIERALLRMVVTRADSVKVQALYRMKSAEQRLAVKLPEGAKVDVQPRINGKPVALEQGTDALYIPLVDVRPEAPFLLEVQYSVPGNGSRLEYPDFPAQPAVQEVVLAVYLPKEWALVGEAGPWSEQFTWRLDGSGRWRPLSRMAGQDVDAAVEQELGKQFLQGGPAAAPIESFPTDGRLYVFSSIDPVESQKGALRLTTVHEDLFHGLLFGVVVLGGIALVPARARVRTLVAGLFVIILVLSAVFWPIFARQVLSGVLAAAVAVVLIVWVVRFALRCPIRFRSRGAGVPPVSPPADEPKSDEPKGESSHD